MKKEKLTTLLELSQELNITKSKLLYYANIGLLKYVQVIGNVHVFDRMETIKKIKKIETLKKEGYKLSEIREKL